MTCEDERSSVERDDYMSDEIGQVQAEESRWKVERCKPIEICSRYRRGAQTDLTRPPLSTPGNETERDGTSTPPHPTIAKPKPFFGLLLLPTATPQE
jgi:hypothetical protein